MVYYAVMHGSTQLDDVIFDLAELIADGADPLTTSLIKANNLKESYKVLGDGETWQIFKIVVDKAGE